MKKQWYTDPLLAAVFASWAVAFVLIKKALAADGGFSPLAFLWPRMLLSTLILLAILPVIRQSWRIPRQHIMKTVVIGVVGLAAYHLLFTVALRLTTPLDTALIVGTGPVMTAIWMPLFKMERTPLRGWIGVIICFGTVAAIAIGGASSSPDHSGWDTERIIGDLIMLVAANCWAINGILCKRALPYMKPTTITAHGVLWATVALFPFCVYSMFSQDWGAVSATNWWYFAYAVVPASTLSIVFYYYGVKKVGPLHTIVYQSVQPIITAGVVFLIDDKSPNIYQIVGVFTVFLGVYLTRTSKREITNVVGADC